MVDGLDVLLQRICRCELKMATGGVRMPWLQRAHVQTVAACTSHEYHNALRFLPT